MTYSLEFALLLPKIIPCHAWFRHGVTRVRWTIADEPESSVMCSQWCTTPAVNDIFLIRNTKSVHDDDESLSSVKRIMERANDR